MHNYYSCTYMFRKVNKKKCSYCKNLINLFLNFIRYLNKLLTIKTHRQPIAFYINNNNNNLHINTIYYLLYYVLVYFQKTKIGNTILIIK